MIITAVFLQAIIFQIFSQVAKKLREKDIPGIYILYYLRLALYPSLIFLFISWDQASFIYLREHPHITAIFGIFIVCQAIFQYVYFVSRHMMKSLTLVSVVLNAAGLPLALLGGYLINHNVPSHYELVALMLLGIAVFIRPGNPKATNGQSLYPAYVIAGIIISYLILQFVKDPLYREFLTNVPNLWFGVALFMVCSTLLINIFFLFKPLPDTGLIKRKRVQKLAYAIPVLWVLGSLPEGYSFAHLPVYTIVAIGTIGFLMNLGSDLYNKRVRLDVRTLIFSVLAISGILITVISHR